MTQTISIIIVIITGHVVQTLYLEMKKIVFTTSGYNHPIISYAPGHHSIASKGSKEKLKQILEKNVISIKELVERIGDLSKLTLEQKNYFL